MPIILVSQSFNLSKVLFHRSKHTFHCFLTSHPCCVSSCSCTYPIWVNSTHNSLPAEGRFILFQNASHLVSNITSHSSWNTCFRPVGKMFPNFACVFLSTINPVCYFNHCVVNLHFGLLLGVMQYQQLKDCLMNVFLNTHHVTTSHYFYLHITVNFSALWTKMWTYLLIFGAVLFP